MKLKQFDKFYGQRDGDHYERKASNGEVLWAIIRPDPSGIPNLVTFFFRRLDQPATAQRLDVNKIVFAKKLMQKKVSKV